MRRRQPKPSVAVRLAVNIPLTFALVVLSMFEFGALQTLKVSSINMMPTLEPEDHVMVRAYGHEPVRGDVVVYRSPFDGEHLQVGRIVGIAGDRVELDENGLMLDGQAVSVPVSGDCAASSCESGNTCGATASASESCRLTDGIVGAENLGDHRFFTRRASGIPSLLFPSVAVPEEHFFILSDNRVDERDSRIYGPIPHYAVVGVLSFVYYASDETGIRWDRMSRRVS